MKLFKSLSLIIVVSMLLINCNGKEKNRSVLNTAKISITGTMKADLTAPPFVPAPVGDRPAKKLIVDMDQETKNSRL